MWGTDHMGVLFVSGFLSFVLSFCMFVFIFQYICVAGY